MAKKVEKIDALIFIDTNIFLDFYRIRRTDVSMKYLEEIVKHKDIIITSSQVEMEYKKNRQSAILESITEDSLKDNLKQYQFECTSYFDRCASTKNDEKSKN